MRCCRALLTSAALLLAYAGQLSAQCDLAKEADTYFQPLVSSKQAYAAAFVSVWNGIPQPVRTYGDVNPNKTLWRAASVSKAFTALAVMQLSQDGKLDLDADVERYLPSGALRNHYSQPVTPRQLLLHTGGVDDRFIGDGFTSGSQPGMTQIVSEKPLGRVYEPGRLEFYSNYGYALLGAAIERVSGQRFEVYMQQHVLHTLGMENSTFEQPLPAPWTSRMAPGKWVYQRAAAAASLTTTAEDLGLFLSATLNRGGGLVSEATFEQMVQPAPDGARIVHGMGYWTGRDQGRRLIAASGDIEDFHNLLLALPELHSGFAILVSGPRSASTWNFYQKFMSHCIGSSPAAVQKNAVATAEKQGDAVFTDVAGLYRTVRYPHRELSKTFILFDATRVRASTDGSLEFRGNRYIRNSNGEYIPAAGGPAIHFIQTEDRKRFLIEPGSPALEKIGWWETGTAAVACYLGTLIIFIIGLVKTSGVQRLLCAAPIIYSLGWLLTVLAYGPGNLILGMPLLLKVFLAIGTALPVVLTSCLVVAWKNRSKTMAICTIAQLPLLLIALYWHLYWP